MIIMDFFSVRLIWLLMSGYHVLFCPPIMAPVSVFKGNLQPLLDSRKTASNNSQGRLNREIRRRTRVVGVFPGRMSYLRLVVTYLMEYEDDCQSERCYLSAKAIMEQKRLLECAA